MSSIRELMDTGSRSDDAAKRVKAKWPDDTVLLATAATAIETPAGPPLKRSWKRYAQIRCNVVITDRRIVVQSSWRSVFMVMWLGMLVWGIVGYMWYDRWYGLFISPLAVAMLLQRRPFRRVLDRASLTDVKVGSIRSVFGIEADLLALTTGGRTVHVVTAARIPPEVVDRLSAGLP